MTVATYRRELPQYRRKNIIDKYKNLRDAKGGLFTPTMRRRLLGVKLLSSKEYKEDTADFWYDVRKTVKSGLKDIELICDMAHPDQLKEMFTETLFNEEKAEIAEWFSVWLKQPEIFSDWLELRQRSKDFRERFKEDEL